MFKTLLASLLILAMAGAAQAQTAPWDTNVITLQLPTQCMDDSPIANCPIIAIRIEEAPSATGAWRALVTLPTVGTVYNHVGVSAGQHCYRAFIDSTAGRTSDPSNISCRTNTRPPSPPKPAVITVAAIEAYIPVKRPGYWAMGDQIGTARLGAECDSGQNYGNGFYALKHPKTDVTYYIGRKPRAPVASRCA